MELGLYRHFKGNMYVVVGVATHSETLETLVVYHREHDSGHTWVRPIDMFNSPSPDCHDIEEPRFTFIKSL